MIVRSNSTSERFLAASAAPAIVVEYFRRCRRAGRLAHAYLFSGPRGAGKSAFARDLGRALFCASGEPCGACDSCRSFEHGNHPGVQIYSPADRPASMDMEQVRDLNEQDHRRHAGLSVFVIEEAQTLSAEALNALLKTLEEPHPGTLLLLTAPSSGSLLPTIVSRCHRIPFPGNAELVGGDAAVTESTLDSQLAQLQERGFHAHTNPQEWCESLFPEAATSRERVGLLLDVCLGRLRKRWPQQEGGSGPDPAQALARLAGLRSDLDRHVNPELILEAAIRELRGAGVRI